ncbi:MAG: histidine kinase [Prevotella sp.]|nr:histidine kinase [Prevotella sp.]
MKQQSRQENILYLAMWAMLFMAPILSMYVSIVSGERDSFDWHIICFAWQRFAIFLGLFLIHNFVLAPLLVNEHKRLLYCSLIVAIVAGFIIYQNNTRPSFPDRHRPPMEERMEQRMEQRMHHDGPDGPDGHPGEPRMRHHDGPPAFRADHDIIALVILILMFGMNLGVKGYFKNRTDQRKIAKLEKENLEQQLEYLKYQINPHFFMNTLNNIHALVDIDPAKAQETILELSKMMRFILYEGDKNGVSLSREMEFIKTYISLMRLRYSDKVTINVNLPAEVPERTIPPLMLISFVENAFKHGISYQHPSFIDIQVAVDKEHLKFLCRNSKAEKPNQEKGGVGLQNVKQRLQLLFDDNYTLNIQDRPEAYQVELIIPLL